MNSLPLPPPPGDGDSPPSPEKASPYQNIPPPSSDYVARETDVLKRRGRFSWRSFGGDGFLISVAFHVLLVIAGLFYVVSKYVGPKAKPETEVFATGSGGGQNGDKAKSFEHKMKAKMNTPVKTPSRIVSRNSNSSVTLSATPMTSTASFASGLSAGGMSKGSGGGSGGGAGTGMGIGKGGSNFVGRFLGMKVQAKRVAVYMDASGSMTSYLKRVEDAAKTYFPEADVFRANGIFVVAEDSAVAWGSSGKTGFKFNGKAAATEKNDPAKFSDLGRSILKKHDEEFQKGSVGAWFDHMIFEKYDALIIFSDFNDGVVQRGKSGDLYVDKPGKEIVDTRKSGEKTWETRWIRTLEKAKTGGAPKVYVYSINTVPQALWQKCAEVSGGAVIMVPWMKDPNGKPPEDGTQINVVDRIDRDKGRTDTPAKVR